MFYKAEWNLRMCNVQFVYQQICGFLCSEAAYTKSILKQCQHFSLTTYSGTQCSNYAELVSLKYIYIYTLLVVRL